MASAGDAALLDADSMGAMLGAFGAGGVADEQPTRAADIRTPSASDFLKIILRVVTNVVDGDPCILRARL